MAKKKTSTPYPYQFVPKAAIPKDYTHHPVMDLELGVAGANLLACMEVKTVGELMQYSVSDLQKWRSISKPIKEVVHALDQIGVQLVGTKEFKERLNKKLMVAP